MWNRLWSSGAWRCRKEQNNVSHSNWSNFGVLSYVYYYVIPLILAWPGQFKLARLD